MPAKPKTLIAAQNLTPLLNSADLQQLLRISRRTLDRFCLIGLLPRPLKIGNTNRWRLEEVKQALEKLAGQNARHHQQAVPTLPGGPGSQENDQAPSTKHH